MNDQKDLFQLEEGTHYLNCAYMSPLLKSVEEAGIRGIRAKRNPFHVTPADFFLEVNKVQQEFSKLIDAKASNRISIIPSVSYGMSVIASNIHLNPGENIVVMKDQFPSNFYPWERIAKNGIELRIVGPDDGSKDKGANWNRNILKAIDSKTKLVAMSHVHWADGTVFDLKSIRKASRDVGALMVIDGTQSVGALPFNVSEFDPDALICAGYKWLMGPYSMGLAYFGPAFDDALPIEENWINRKNSEHFKDLVNYQSEYQPGAARFSVGEQSNFILIPMMLEALKQLNEWGVQNINDYCENLLNRFIPEFEKLGFAIEDQRFRSAHLFGIRKKGLDIEDLQQKLATEKVFVSLRGYNIRISINIFNTEDDLRALLDVLEKVSVN